MLTRFRHYLGLIIPGFNAYDLTGFRRDRQTASGLANRLAKWVAGARSYFGSSGDCPGTVRG